MKNLESILKNFLIKGEVKEITPFGNGLINDTFKVSTHTPTTPDYILQKINHHVFQNVETLQHNIRLVTTHLREKLLERGEKDVERKTLTFIDTEDGKNYWFDGENYWRVMLFIPNAKTFEAVTPEYAYYAGKAFGNFQYMLSDLPEKLGDTIPNFHNMEYRLVELKEAIQKDKANRVKDVSFFIDELLKREQQMCQAEELHRKGKLEKRVCHCDTKVNNMMFDSNGEVLCVIDLDTVMPNFIFSDYGDFLRTGANKTSEDDPNLDKVSFDMDIFKSFTKGYLESASIFLTPIEIKYLPFAASLFPYMQCVRFLTDYINGDTYYKIQYPDHNLVRTKNQFKLLQSVEANLEQMEKYITNSI